MKKDAQVNRKAVADLLNGRLDRLGQSQRWLANRAGVSESSLSDILKGKQDITVPQANRLASVEELGLTATVILATAADAELSEDQRLIESMGLIGALYRRLSSDRREQVQDLITVLFNKEKSTDATSTKPEPRRPPKPPK
jgi:plasmid maintenance system antidote protein VapI